ncbi:MAG: hypothetical protein ACFFCS_29690 [Candidatus Hodarchaeota archaeon]
MSEENTLSEDEILSEIEKYLKRLEVRYGRTKLGDQDVIGAPWVIDDKDFLVLIRIKNDWIWISAALILKEDYPQGKEEEFLLECLKANHTLPEICFDADQEGNLGTSQELHVTAINNEGGFFEYKYEFFAIPACIKYFMNNIAPKFNITVKGFTDMVDNFIKKVQD